MSLSIASSTSYKQRKNHQPPAADFCTTELMYNKLANVTTSHCYVPASWLTFCAFAAAMASFRFCTLPDSMAFLSALAACIDHSSHYAFNIIQHLQLARRWWFCMVLSSASTRQRLTSSAGLSIEENTTHQHKLGD